jgi:iron complex outermembrane receptor protein
MDRFSTRFNSALSNPNLLPERAINYEIGGADTLFGNTRVEGAVFYSRVTDVIETVPILFNGAATTESQNVGNGNYYGYEISGDSRITDALQLGLRFSYINRNIDAQNPANPPVTANFHLTGEPYDQLLVYASYDILPQLTLMPSIQVDSDRWTTNTAGTAYFKTGDFFLLNLEADYRLTDRMDVSVGARNLLDLNYQLAAGFPEEGRSFFLNLRIRS